MRRPYDKLPKKCVVAIMAASMAMSITAQSAICPMVVYADTPDQEIIVSGCEQPITDNQGNVIVNTGGTVVVTNNSGGIVVNSGGNGTVTVNSSAVAVNDGGTLAVTSNASGGEAFVSSGGTLTIASNISGGQVFVSGGSASIGVNVGSVNVRSGGYLTVDTMSGGSAIISSGGSASVNEGLEGRINVQNGGILTASSASDVTVNAGGIFSCDTLGGGSNVFLGSDVTISSVSYGANAQFAGGDGTIVYNSGTVMTTSGGDVTISNNCGEARLFASGTVIDNYALVVLGSGSTPSYGTVINNYGTALLETGGTLSSNFGSATLSSGTLQANYGTAILSGGTVTTNHVGGIISGSSGVVVNNHGGAIDSGISVTNQYWSVTVTGLGASYDASFQNISGGSYLQTINGGTAIGATGQITISPAGGYELTVGGAMSGSTATYDYTLTRDGDNYVLTISNLTGNAVISPEQLQLVLTAIRSATGSGDDSNDGDSDSSYDGSEVLPIYYSPVEITKMIDNILVLTQKASGGKVPVEIILDLKTLRGFSPDSARMIFEYQNLIAKRLIIRAEGKRYQVLIPAGVNTKGKVFIKALTDLEEEEKKGIVGPLKFAEIFRGCGVTASLIE
ncbi:MAG: hypothetical protein K5868_07690 [Lachnospiraceae bacterium]|nr:hypothetical protein [Lachnospiraceae bacterium]